MKFLRCILLLVAAAWLGLSGVIIPDLYTLGAHTAMAHVVILSFLAVAMIVWLTKPDPKGSRRRG